MKIRPTSTPAEPGYPTAREFSRNRHRLGAATLGAALALSACSDGPRNPPSAVPENPEVERTGGVFAPTPAPDSPQAAPHETRLSDAAITITPEPADADATTYRIQKGDTLSGIAAAKLGAVDRWPEIVNLNPGLNPKALRVGQSLRLPPASARTTPDDRPPRLQGEAMPVPKPTRVRLAGAPKASFALPDQSEERLPGKVKTPAPPSGEHP